jgi:hypothetical protein
MEYLKFKECKYSDLEGLLKGVYKFRGLKVEGLRS